PRCRLGHVISCVQSQLIASHEERRASVPPVSIQCLVSVFISASCQCPSVPHQCQISVPTSAYLSCLSVSPISASQCHLSVLPSVPPISAMQCRISMR
ncbi:unnamed protein product, partial [Staurois parvus]